MTPGTDGVAPALLGALRGRAEEIVGSASERVRAHADLPDEARAAALDAVRHAIALRLDLVAEDRDATPDDDRLLRSCFRLAARRGVPLDVQLRLARSAVAVTLYRLWELAGPGHLHDVLELSARFGRHHQRMERVAVDAYCTMFGAERAASGVRAAHAESLLAGDPPSPGEEIRPPGAGCYRLVLLPGRGGPPPLDRLGDDPRWLHTERDGADVVLLPEGPSTDDVAAELAAAARGAGRGTAVAVPAAVPDEVPAAYERARALLGVVPAIIGDPWIVTPEDALPERLVAADDEVAAELVALLDLLDAQPALRETVEAFLDCDLDRAATARRLHVHRRTLSERLCRIRDLTGYDPRTSAGVQVFGLAVAARELARRGR